MFLKLDNKAKHYDIFDPFLCHLNEELEFDDKME